MSLLQSSRALRLRPATVTNVSPSAHLSNVRQLSDGIMGDAALFSYSSRFKRSPNSVDPASKLPFKLSDLTQSPPMPKRTRPIYVIGAGGIVQNAHLPAYKLAHFDVIGLCDANKATADKVAHDWKLHIAHKTVPELVAAIKKPTECVFDVAVPASAVLSVLQQLPEESTVLIQKPLGENLAEARKIRDLCRDKKLRAAVNFQLRYAPNILAMKDIIQRGAIGDIHSIDFRVNTFMPWHLWSFLEKSPRMEIPYHSIHYIDCMRMFMGEPSGVHAFTRKDPSTPNLHSSRSVMAFNYGQNIQASIVTNHAHNFGTKHAESYLKIEGTKGAVKAQLGLHLQYGGSNDYLDFWSADVKDWLSVPLKGSWIPHAFIGPMASMMRWMEDPQTPAPTRIEDAFRTMAVVEAAYTSNASEGTPIPKE